MFRIAWPAVVLALALAACGGSEPPPERKEAKGREETRNIRNTEAIGYAGDAVADKVDAALDASERRKQQLDGEIEAQVD